MQISAEAVFLSALDKDFHSIEFWIKSIGKIYFRNYVRSLLLGFFSKCVTSNNDELMNKKSAMRAVRKFL